MCDRGKWEVSLPRTFLSSVCRDECARGPGVLGGGWTVRRLAWLSGRGFHLRTPLISGGEVVCRQPEGLYFILSKMCCVYLEDF